MIAGLIDIHALLKMLYASVLAGVGVAVVFSVAILGATRWSDMRREQRTGAATAYGVLAAVALLLSSAIVIYGLILVAHKS
jgi:MFS family permease